jgi:hypothetical protein
MTSVAPRTGDGGGVVEPTRKLNKRVMQNRYPFQRAAYSQKHDRAHANAGEMFDRSVSAEAVGGRGALLEKRFLKKGLCP